MTQLVFANARVFDGSSAECAEGMHVLVTDGEIDEVSSKRPKAKDARVIDVGERTLMPGLIDCHIHAFFSDVRVDRVEALGDAYRTVHAVRMLQFALQCGFTTVRDIGGGNYSLWKALADRLFEGPRYFYSGKVMTMTGGHADMRQIEEPPRYQVRWEDGHTSILTPSSGSARIEPKERPPANATA